MPGNDLYDLLAQADPETLRAMMSAGLTPDRMAALNGQKTAQGREVGNTYVASSPLEHLANALRGMREQQMIGQQGQGREAYLRLLAQQGQGQQPSNPSQFGPYASGYQFDPNSPNSY